MLQRMKDFFLSLSIEKTPKPAPNHAQQYPLHQFYGVGPYGNQVYFPSPPVPIGYNPNAIHNYSMFNHGSHGLSHHYPTHSSMNGHAESNIGYPLHPNWNLSPQNQFLQNSLGAPYPNGLTHISHGHPSAAYHTPSDPSARGVHYQPHQQFVNAPQHIPDINAVPPNATKPPFDVVEDQDISDSDDEMDDWPQGQVRRENPTGSDKSSKWKASKWVWRSRGNVTYEGVQAEKRTCLGVIICANPNCHRLSRPRTQTTTRDAQLRRCCPLCHSKLRLESCNAVTHHYTIQKGGTYTDVWEHSGHHQHPRPPGGSLSSKEKNAVDHQVSRRPHASVHALRTGDIDSGSVPLGEISPALTNPRAARYQVAQSQERLGLASSTGSKGAFSVISSISALQEEFKKPFIIDSSIHGPVYLSFQTPFMRQILEESVYAWSQDINLEGPNSCRHGLVTDGDHTFFKEGILNMTCVFSTVVSAWIPVLYTWIKHPDTVHNRVHFRPISVQVVNFITSKQIVFHSKYLLHVMDFSAAQRAAHAEEYADALILLTPGYHSLAPASQRIEREKYLEEAQTAEQGCDFHFWQSATRIKRNGALIPAAQKGDFDRLLGILLGKSTTRPKFDNTVKEIYRLFPRIDPWLSWWIRPKIASMIFPACNATETTVISQVPRTANPAEHSHSLLHHAVGQNQELVSGIKKLFLHVNELERQYQAVKVGHYNIMPAQESRPSNKVKPNNPNDGRAPDTEEALHPDGIRDPGVANENALVSYAWSSPNSCFFDHGLELWFRSFSLWTANTRRHFKTIVPKDSFLGQLVFHYDRRQIAMYKATDSLTVPRTLSMMQVSTRHAIFEKWKIYSNPTAFGSCTSWLSYAVTDGNLPVEIMQYFGLYSLVSYTCASGHSEEGYASQEPLVLVPIFHPQMVLTQGSKSIPITLSDYFMRHIPVERVIRGDGIEYTRPLHLQSDDTLHRCSHKGCLLTCKIASITTLWPQVLTLQAVFGFDALHLKYATSFSIPDLQSPNDDVTYTLVGRVLFSANHFIAQIRFQDKVYVYDDMVNKGQLSLASNPQILEEFDNRAVYYVYHRTSMKSTTTRHWEDVRTDYEKGQTLALIRQNQIDSKYAPSLDSDTDDTPHISAPTADASTQRLTVEQASKFKANNFLLCGKDCYSIDEKPDVECSLCDVKWHRSCVGILLPKNYDSGISREWCCPQCWNTENGPFDRLLVGQYLLLPISKKEANTVHYPALVMPRNCENVVELKWFSGNIYPTEDQPEIDYVYLTPQECLDAYFNDQKRVAGSIHWPIQLVDDAHEELQYECSKIQKALEDSFNSVLEIVSGQREHPLVQIFEEWSQEKLKPQAGRKAYSDMEDLLNFSDQFKLEIFPADSSLIEPFISKLMNWIFRANGSTKISRNLKAHCDTVSRILFKVVIVRIYLGTSPDNDLQIFWLSYVPQGLNPEQGTDTYSLAKMGSMRRELSDAEMAIGACLFPKATSDKTWPRNYQITFKPSSHQRLIRHGYTVLDQVIDKSSNIQALFKIVDHYGRPYEFTKTSDRGLTENSGFINFQPIDPEITLKNVKKALTINIPPQKKGTDKTEGTDKTVTSGGQITQGLLSDYFAVSTAGENDTKTTPVLSGGLHPVNQTKRTKRPRAVVEESERRRSKRTKK